MKKLWEWMKLFEEGVELEYQDDYEDWEKIHNEQELVTEYHNRTIRIKPKPKKVVLYGVKNVIDKDIWRFDNDKDFNDTHMLTFEVNENGKPILGTEKLEEIKELINWYIHSKYAEKLGDSLAVCLSTNIINRWKASRVSHDFYLDRLYPPIEL